MALSIAGYIAVAVVLGAPTAAVAGSWVAIKRRSLNLFDAASAVIPVAAFLLIAGQREELHTGWAMLLWPVVVLVFSLYAVAFKLLVLDKLVPKAKRTSVLLTLVLASLAIVLAVRVPQLLE